MTITAATRPLALLGNPVAHSLSPVMQNAAMLAAGVDGVYFGLRCESADVPTLIRALALSGGGGNVTIPHKGTAVTAVDNATEAVAATGACNTFWGEDGRVCGDNTDVAGFESAARHLVGGIEGARVCVLGAGGAARAVVHAVLRAEGSCLVLARSPDSLRRLEASFRDSARLCTGTVPAMARSDSFDLLVNGTPVGLDGDSLPVDLGLFTHLGAVIDLVYRAGGTPLTAEARRRGIAACDGIAMLVAQGAASFERWWQRPAPLDAMRAALAALRPQDND